MKKIEATTLEEAYEQAKVYFDCKISQLDCEIVQYPSKGFLGLGRKSAIIIASCKSKKNKIYADEIEVVEEIIDTKKPILSDDNQKENHEQTNTSNKLDAINTQMYSAKVDSAVHYEDIKCGESIIEPVVDNDLARKIENDIINLFSLSCYHIDVVEVDIVDNNALVFIDGDDVALLIGKDGYRYNAISYMLFNWLYAKYELFVKLEIASFVTSQEEMIANMLLPVIDKVHSDGKGRTRPFKGILVQIALTQLRDAFPSKYVAIKTNKNGDRYIIINDFNKQINE